MDVPDWVNLSDEELLERKISQLGLKLEGTELEPLIRQLYDELTAKNLIFHPPCHVGDMVRSRRHSGDLHPVLSHARTSPQTRTQTHPRSRRRISRMVHETHAPRNRARLRLRLSTAPQKKMAD